LRLKAAPSPQLKAAKKSRVATVAQWPPDQPTFNHALIVKEQHIVAARLRFGNGMLSESKSTVAGEQPLGKVWRDSWLGSQKDAARAHGRSAIRAMLV